MSGSGMKNGPVTYDAVDSSAKKKTMPVFTDAAAEMLTVPNVDPQRNSTFVGYNSGKCWRGPQGSGLIFGRKGLLQVAGAHGRTMGVGKEEMLGLLVAVESRIALGGDGGGRYGGGNQTGISITACRMQLSEIRIVDDRNYEILAAKRPHGKTEVPKYPAADLTGRWKARIQFAAATFDHTCHVKQQGTHLVGTQHDDFVARDFTGKLEGDSMSGALVTGAKWIVTRLALRRGDRG